jgi:hypothetical protein
MSGICLSALSLGCEVPAFKVKVMVRKGGFEPPRLSAPPPQDGVSANSTTSALPLTAIC